MKKLAKIFFGSLSFLFLSLFLFFTMAKLFPLDLTSKKEKITLYDMNQNIYYESNFNEELSWHSLDEYPKQVIELIVQIEDKRFYEHLGADPIRITKAFITNLAANRIVEGGSSISQQMAKNLFLSNDQTLSRKIEELFYAVQMEMQYSKETILESYLNTLYFGHGIYGMFDASMFFYGQPLQDLTIAQIVLLIGVINGPSIYSPFINEAASFERKNILLDYLYSENQLSELQYKQAKNENIHFIEEAYEINNASYYIQAVLDELAALNIDSKGGLDIYTSYHPKAQETLTESIQKNASKDDCEASGIILNPSSGGILALSGGKNYTVSQFIRPLYSKRQVGSAIKPLLYYNALQAGFTPSTTFMSTATSFQIDENSTYSPTNYKEKYPNREISLINAIAVSDNIYAMKTHLFLGENVLSDSLKAFHITAKPTPSLALGTCEMSLLELSSIYNTFASSGIYHQPYLIDIIFQGEHVIYEKNQTKSQLLDRDKTLILNQLLTSPFDIKNKTVATPTLYNLHPSVKVSAKSGTSDFDSVIVGFNPDYTVGIWTGFDDSRLLDSDYYEQSKTIFQDTFIQLYKDETVSGWYQKSKNIESKIVDPISGEESLLGSEYWYIK